MKSYMKYLGIHLKSSLEYKTSFILSIISQIIVFFSYYFSVIALFERFSNIKGYTLYEVLLTFAIIQIGFSCIEIFARGLDRFDTLASDITAGLPAEIEARRKQYEYYRDTLLTFKKK